MYNHNMPLSPLWFLLLMETKLQLQWHYFHYANALQEQSLTTLHAIHKGSPSGTSTTGTHSEGEYT